MADTTTPLGRLMHDFRCVRSEEMFYEVLAKQAGAFKNMEKGVIHMSSKWEQFVEEITAEAMDVLAIPQSEWGRYKAML